MSRINQPKNQIRLTNVSIVRLRDGPNTFELACYPNKVKDWRQGKETDLSEVLQSDKIFSCVGKGQFARDAELIGSFGTSDFYACVKQILAQGTIQLSTRERMVQQQQFQKEVYVLTAPRLLPLKATLAL
ncbi:shwachman-bodian-diamond syndrome protein, partial [Gregarina niphandrodes]